MVHKPKLKLYIKIYETLKKHTSDEVMKMVAVKNVIKTAIEYAKTRHEQGDEHDVDNFKLVKDDLVELYNLYKHLGKIDKLTSEIQIIEAKTLKVLCEEVRDFLSDLSDLSNLNQKVIKMLDDISKSPEKDTSDVRTSIIREINDNNDTVYIVEISVPNKFHNKSSMNTYTGSDYAISSRTQKFDGSYKNDDIITSTSSKLNETTGDITYTVDVSIPKKYSPIYNTVSAERTAYDILKHHKQL